MAKTAEGRLVPAYDVRHFALAMEIDELFGDRPKGAYLLENLVATKHNIFSSNEIGLEAEFRAIIEELNKIPRADDKPAITLEGLLAKYGFGEGQISSPFYIDSIAFSTDKHQPALHQSIESAFKAAARIDKKASVIVLGGSDSKHWYSPLEAKDLHRRGWLENKVIFISSMHSFEEEPLHVARVIKAAKRAARNPFVPGGAYAVSARHDDAGRVALYELRRDFVKSSTGVNAFRGIHVGTSIDGGFAFDETYDKKYIEGGEILIVPPDQPYTGETKYANIAPPILSGSSTGEIIALLTAYGTAIPSFDAIIIEGLPGISGPIDNHPTDLAAIKTLVAQITAGGTKVIFNNNRMFNENFKPGGDEPVLKPEINDRWQSSRESGFLYQVQRVGGENVIVSSKTPNDAYNDALLRFHGAGESGIVSSTDTTTALATLGIRYTPSTSSFAQGLEIAVGLLRDRNPDPEEGKEPTLVISGLPGNCISPDHSLLLQRLLDGGGVNVVVTFDYNCRTRKDGKIEGRETNPYGAAAACAPFAKPSPNTPQKEMENARARCQSTARTH